MLITGDLPALSAEDSAQSARVAAQLRALIAGNGGWLPFSRFMEAALYAPELGYYMSDRVRFGSEGDFVTAPELSPLYQACLANGIARLLAQAGGGDVVEFGAGSGLLSASLLGSLERRGALPRRYRIVEVSPDLRRRQQRYFDRWPGSAALRDRVEWLEAPPRDAWQGVAFANEVVDALPVERFRVHAGGCEQIGVVEAGSGFAWQARPADAALRQAVNAIQRRLPQPMPEGYVSEIRTGAGRWLADATAGLAQGAMLVIDYGLPRAQYYHPSRDGGTLCGFRRHHRVEDALATPGVQDLTAWVDFSQLAEAATACGLDVGGFATQAHFLLSLGIDRELAALVEHAAERDRRAHRQDAATLLLPGEMGERFKVMALARGVAGPFAGFGFRDFSGSL